MKTTFKNSSLFALGMVAAALLTSAPVTKSAPVAPAPVLVTLKTLSLPSALQVAGKDGDGQETHGDKGKTKG